MEKMINFTKYRLVFLFSTVGLIALFWIGLLVQGGFNLGIDFQSGINQRVLVDSAPSIGEMRTALGSIEGIQIQTVGGAGDGEYMLRVQAPSDDKNFQVKIQEEIKTALSASFDSFKIQSTEFVGSRFSRDLTSQTLFLTVMAMLLILIYIWIRFKLNYAVSAIAAIAHDVLFMLGFIGLLRLEVSTATIAAVLTIIGYSLNDTIVIFDRIRENSYTVKDKSFEDIINMSITQSLSRTLITSLTTLLAVISIYIFATGAIRLFALNLIVGVVVGTYSSIFIASTILLAWHDKHVENVSRKLKKD